MVVVIGGRQVHTYQECMLPFMNIELRHNIIHLYTKKNECKILKTKGRIREPLWTMSETELYAMRTLEGEPKMTTATQREVLGTGCSAFMSLV